MIEIAGTQFPLTFEPQMAGRELVLLGVHPDRCDRALDALAIGVFAGLVLAFDVDP